MFRRSLAEEERTRTSRCSLFTIRILYIYIYIHVLAYIYIPGIYIYIHAVSHHSRGMYVLDVAYCFTYLLLAGGGGGDAAVCFLLCSKKDEEERAATVLLYCTVLHCTCSVIKFTLLLDGCCCLLLLELRTYVVNTFVRTNYIVCFSVLCFFLGAWVAHRLSLMTSTNSRLFCWCLLGRALDDWLLLYVKREMFYCKYTVSNNQCCLFWGGAAPPPQAVG